MSASSEDSILKQFFAGYFHEDWPDDAKGSEQVVVDYLRAASGTEVTALADAITDLAHSGRSDAELEDTLFRELGCYYVPSGSGQSAKAWLEQLTTQLRASRTDGITK